MIDGALRDYETSEDAMRWSPEPVRVICDGGDVLWPERYNVWRHGTYYMQVTPLISGDALAAMMRAVTVTFSEFGAGLNRFMQNVTGAFSSYDSLLAVIRDANRSHAAALSAMHREYRRRSRARQRRKRK